jgi:hypothetical protein
MQVNYYMYKLVKDFSYSLARSALTAVFDVKTHIKMDMLIKSEKFNPNMCFAIWKFMNNSYYVKVEHFSKIFQLLLMCKDITLINQNKDNNGNCPTSSNLPCTSAAHSTSICWL